MLIRKFLDLSTAHLRPNDCRLLDRSADPNGCSALAAVMKSDYGWFVYVAEERSSADISDELWEIFQQARTQGCDYVMFDADAPIDPELPVFDQADGEQMDDFRQLQTAHAETNGADGSD